MAFNDPPYIKYFQAKYKSKPLEIRNKVKYLVYVNLLGIIFLGVLFVIHFLQHEGKYSIIGQFLSLLLFLISLYFIKNKKVYLAGNLTVFAFLAYNFSTYVLDDFFYADSVSPQRIYESLSFILFAVLVIGLFSIKKMQIVLFSTVSFFLLVAEVFIIFDKTSVPFDFKEYMAVVISFLIFGAATYASLMVLVKNKELVTRADNKIMKNHLKYKSLFENLEDGFAYIKITYSTDHSPVDARFVEVNESFKKIADLNEEDILNHRISKSSDNIRLLFGNFEAFLAAFKTGNYYKTSVYVQRLQKTFELQAYVPMDEHIAVLFRENEKTNGH